MPISEYFGGHGKGVMAGMRKKHGKRAEEVFYATANKRGMKPKSHMPKHGANGVPSHICCARAEESRKAGGFGSKHMMMGGGGY